LEIVSKQIREILRQYHPEFLIAGPAFNAGRYGVACGTVCKLADELGIKAVSGMFEENPGVELFRRYAFIVPTANSAAGMRHAVKNMSSLIKKMVDGEKIDDPERDGYIKRGLRVNYLAEKTGAVRCVDMLLDRIHGREIRTELPMPTYKKIPPSLGILELRKARIALLTTGGLVPEGNPDHIEAALASKFRKYDYSIYHGTEAFSGEVCHGGYDPTYCNEDANRMLPVDIVSELEKEQVIGELYPFTYVTSGNGMSNKNALQFGKEIAQDLLTAEVDGAILTSA
jgi:glycine reductase